MIFGDWSKYDVFSETQIFVLTNNLRCFDETGVRTSQKTTYAQFKIYRTNFIDEIGPRTTSAHERSYGGIRLRFYSFGS